MTASYLAGVVGSFLVWNFIYSIGARVITDEMYANLHDTVVFWGGVAGALVGFSAVLLQRRPALKVLAIAHALATLAGFIGGAVSWRAGLYAYFGGLIIFLGGVILWIVFVGRSTLQTEGSLQKSQ